MLAFRAVLSWPVRPKYFSTACFFLLFFWGQAGQAPADFCSHGLSSLCSLRLVENVTMPPLHAPPSLPPIPPPPPPPRRVSPVNRPPGTTNTPNAAALGGETPPRNTTQHPTPNSDVVSCGYSGVVFAWMVVLSLKPDAVRKDERGREKRGMGAEAEA